MRRQGSTVSMTSEEEDYWCRQGSYRHEFECWASGTHLYKDISRCPNGLYAAQRTQGAWDGWVSCLLQERRPC